MHACLINLPIYNDSTALSRQLPSRIFPNQVGYHEDCSGGVLAGLQSRFEATERQSLWSTRAGRGRLDCKSIRILNSIYNIIKIWNRCFWWEIDRLASYAARWKRWKVWPVKRLGLWRSGRKLQNASDYLDRSGFCTKIPTWKNSYCRSSMFKACSSNFNIQEMIVFICWVGAQYKAYSGIGLVQKQPNLL